jgi:hypothetical protein
VISELPARFRRAGENPEEASRENAVHGVVIKIGD